MFEFSLIQPGTFMMGSHENEEGRYFNETLRKVTITKPFYMQSTPVTQEQWKEVMGTTPSFFAGKNLPVENISWYDVQEFIKKINQLNMGIYRLPTEAEWEYACRAGSQSAFFFGDDAAQAGRYAWTKTTSEGKTHPVAQKEPNAWGLYDMHGNVCEWVQDWYRVYRKKDISDPLGAIKGSKRVARGGAWVYENKLNRAAYRDRFSADVKLYMLGFRLVKEV